MREWLFRALVAGLLLGAGLLLYFAFDTGREEEPAVRRGAILRVFPQPSTVALRQDAIGADLAFGYSAVLSIDDVRIPEDQVDVVAGINRWSFTPGEGKEIEELAEGRHCASIEYLTPTLTSSTLVPPGTATSTALPERPRVYSWCFNAA
ncbi:MAG TPA: hypothetical protein VFV35_05650 [Acidimicrobiales bacterium]|nr:hypothetical protein [Acidimicrobiales bacterium]